MMLDKAKELREKIESSAGYRASVQLELLALNFHVLREITNNGKTMSLL